MASGGLQRLSKAGRGRIFFWLKWFLLTPVSIPDGPWWSSAPPAASRPSKAGRGRNFFLAQTVPFDHSIDPWWSLTVSGPPGPSSGLEAIKGQPRPNFFLAQTVPFVHSIDPWWSLMFSGLPGTLQRPQGREGQIFLGLICSFWPLHWSLMVSDSVGPPQDPSSGLEATKAAKAEIFFKG